MAQPRTGFSWPTAGERQVKCALQYATPTIDAMGGRTEPTWTQFGEWWAKVTVVPIVPNETEAVLLYEAEGPYRSDLVEFFLGTTRPVGISLPTGFTGGLAIRIVTTSLTLKVFQIEDPQLRHRTLVAHCANAVNTQ